VEKKIAFIYYLLGELEQKCILYDQNLTKNKISHVNLSVFGPFV